MPIKFNLGRFGSRKDNVKLGNKCVGYGRMVWIQLTHDKEQLLASLKIPVSKYFN